MAYLSIDEIVDRSEEGYPQKVRGEVLERLIRRGHLSGKETGGKMFVEDGPRLQQVLGCGVEQFVYNTQGWTFVAVRAPLEDVARRHVG